MDEILISIIPTDGDATECCADVKKQLDSVVVKTEVSRGFLGAEEIQLLILVGTGALINQVAHVLSQWLKRNEPKSVRFNGIELKGYSVSEVRILLESMVQTDENQ